MTSGANWMCVVLTALFLHVSAFAKDAEKVLDSAEAKIISKSVAAKNEVRSNEIVSIAKKNNEGAVEKTVTPNSVSSSGEFDQRYDCHASGTNLVCIERRQDSYKGTLVPAISFMALLLSLGNIAYTLYKDRRARKQSIEDDFWLRKVISPLALEPLIEGVNDLLMGLPDDCSKSATESFDYRKFAQETQPKLQKLQSSMHVLAMLDKSVCQATIARIQGIEDEILNYCGKNASRSKTAAGQPERSKADTKQTISNHLLGALSGIKNYQSSQV